jgi:hypothetical protein
MLPTSSGGAGCTLFRAQHLVDLWTISVCGFILFPHRRFAQLDRAHAADMPLVDRL